MFFVIQINFIELRLTKRDDYQTVINSVILFVIFKLYIHTQSREYG